MPQPPVTNDALTTGGDPLDAALLTPRTSKPSFYTLTPTKDWKPSWADLASDSDSAPALVTLPAKSGRARKAKRYAKQAALASTTASP